MSRLSEYTRGWDAISITGLCKNAGKTTALNSLLRDTPSEGLALTSIGRDGESVDVATGTPKPRILLRKGTLFATATGLLSQCDITLEVLDTTGFATPLGEVVLLRALSDGFAQLAGPSMVGQLRAVKEAFLRLGAKKILIDGAAGRRSLCSPALAPATVLCVGASCGGTPEDVVRETAYACSLLQLPVAAEGIPHEGALTDRHAQAWLDEGLRDRPILLEDATILLEDATILLEDASRILLSRPFYEKLSLRNIALAVRHPIHLAAVTANPFSAYGGHFARDRFLALLREALPTLPIIDVEESHGL